MTNLNTLKAEFAEQVYEKFKQETFLIGGDYCDSQIHNLWIQIDLLQNNYEVNAYTD